MIPAKVTVKSVDKTISFGNEWTLWQQVFRKLIVWPGLKLGVEMLDVSFTGIVKKQHL
jgi:hypothetical protein